MDGWRYLLLSHEHTDRRWRHRDNYTGNTRSTDRVVGTPTLKGQQRSEESAKDVRIEKYVCIMMF
jgi:hypothetical protein